MERGLAAVRYAMMCAIMLLIWTSFHFWRASKTFLDHFEAVNSDWCLVVSVDLPGSR